MKPSETEETIPGGRIILTQNERASWAQYQMEVVSVGADVFCDKPKKCQRPHYFGTLRGNYHLADSRIRSGAWVLVRPRSLVHAGTEEKLYFVKQSDILGVFQ